MTDPDPREPSTEESALASGGARRHRRPPLPIVSEDLSRIIALSDGVFAFALTLLVLSISVPSVTTNAKLGFDLNHDWSTFYGYAFAFVMIAIWWLVHNRTFQLIARYDSVLVWLNLALLAQIAIMPFALSVYGTYTSKPYDFQYAVVLFAAIQITLGLTTTLIWEYARRAGLTKPDIPASSARYFTRRGLGVAGVFALSIGISFVNVEAAQISWILIVVVQRLMTVEGD